MLEAGAVDFDPVQSLGLGCGAIGEREVHPLPIPREARSGVERVTHLHQRALGTTRLQEIHDIPAHERQLAAVRRPRESVRNEAIVETGGERITAGAVELHQEDPFRAAVAGIELL